MYRFVTEITSDLPPNHQIPTMVTRQIRPPAIFGRVRSSLDGGGQIAAVIRALFDDDVKESWIWLPPGPQSRVV